MKYKLIWSPEAKKDYEQILNYLEAHWTSRESLNFINRTLQVFNIISQTPQLYPKLKNKTINQCVVNKQVSLFYKIKGDNVHLLIFWDNRMNPSKLKL